MQELKFSLTLDSNAVLIKLIKIDKKNKLLSFQTRPTKVKQYCLYILIEKYNNFFFL